MRCPKCQYISFEAGDRCRNCGYEFSLATESADLDLAPLDLPIRSEDEPSGPFTDLVLTEPDARVVPETVPRRGRSDRPSPRQARGGSELPLFRSARPDADAPLVTLPAAPRAPVSVRKSSVAPRPTPAASDDLDVEQELAALSRKVARAQPSDNADPSESSETVLASSLARFGAALLDVTLMLAIDAAVFYFTLEICGLRLDEWRLIPVVPFVAFLLILNGSYLTTFTAAGGQTLGKMITGIRVVNADAAAWTDRVPLAQAVLRCAAYLASALPAGLGFLPAFVGADRRGLHDRIARTRVVKV